MAVSNAPKPNVEAMLKAIHLEDFFEDIMLGELFERPKPFPDPYLAGLKIVGCEKDEVVIFEDSPAGAQLCLAWGLGAVVAPDPGVVRLLSRSSGASSLLCRWGGCA